MKNMSKAVEFNQAPPAGRYLSTIIGAEATTSKKSGASMLHLTVEITDERYAGEQADDYIITDGTAKGAAIGKRKLRGLGTNLILRALDTDEEIPDAAIAQELLGQSLFVDFGNEQKMGRSDPQDPTSAYDRPMTITDPKTGREVPLNKLTVQGYSRHGTGAAVAQAPVAQAPAQQFAPQQAPAQFVPQQFASTPAQVQAFNQQFAPQAPQQGGFPGQQQFAPQGYQQQQQMPFAPQGVAQPVWNGGQQVAPEQVEAPATKGKRARS